MVRVAEALQNAVSGTDVHAIRWTPEGYVLDPHPLDSVDFNDPRHFALKRGSYDLLALTSLSWILPVEISADGRTVVEVHYDKAIEPAATYQHYGVDDARISLIDAIYYMTACSLSSERHCTTLYTYHRTEESSVGKER